jgi:hypothetical protein
VPESADARPRLGELLISSGLLTHEQLEEGLALARAAGKPLGHALVEHGIVPARSIAMALADQHGGPLKTEFGFAMGRISSRPTQDGVPAQRPDSPPILRLAPVVASQAPAVEPDPLASTGALQAELETTRHQSAEHVAALRAEIEALADRLEATAGAEKTLTTTRAELESARAAESSLREARGKDAETLEAWRVQLDAALARQAEHASVAEELAAQLETARARDSAIPEAVAAAEKRTEDLRDELARAVDEHATSVTELDRLRTQVEDLQRRHEADSAAALAEDVAARAATDRRLELVQNQLAAASAEVETAHTMLAAERAAHRQADQTVDELRAQLAALEMNIREPSMNAPLHEDVDELRAVIELQEQALAAAAARERADDGDLRVSISPTHGYSVDKHFLFAQGPAGYEFIERSGPSPAPGATIELSGGRICRVTRVGPAPLPGSTEAWAYLEPA